MMGGWHAGITLGTPIIAGLMALLAVYLKHRLDRQDKQQAAAIAAAAQAAVSAALAADRAEPTGNGYARRTESILGRIEHRLIRLEDRFEAHIDRTE